MYTTVTTKMFERDMKRCKKRGKNMGKLKYVIQILVNAENLPTKYRDHVLIGNYQGRRECYIEPNWLLIYKIDEDKQAIIFERTGTHTDLFNK